MGKEETLRCPTSQCSARLWSAGSRVPAVPATRGAQHRVQWERLASLWGGGPSIRQCREGARCRGAPVPRSAPQKPPPAALWGGTALSVTQAPLWVSLLNGNFPVTMLPLRALWHRHSFPGRGDTLWSSPSGEVRCGALPARPLPRQLRCPPAPRVQAGCWVALSKAELSRQESSQGVSGLPGGERGNISGQPASVTQVPGLGAPPTILLILPPGDGHSRCPDAASCTVGSWSWHGPFRPEWASGPCSSAHAPSFVPGKPLLAGPHLYPRAPSVPFCRDPGLKMHPAHSQGRAGDTRGPRSPCRAQDRVCQEPASHRALPQGSHLRTTWLRQRHTDFLVSYVPTFLLMV